MSSAGPASGWKAYGTAANLVSLARLLLAIPIIALYVGSGGEGSLLVLALFVVAGITDGLDGYLARVRGEISEFGAMLDPVVDKVFGVAIFAALVWSGALASWMLWTLIAKELLLLVGGALLLKGRKIVVAARRLGKVATVVLLVGWGAILAGLHALGYWVTLAGLLLSLGAGLDYALHARRLLASSE